MRKGSTQNSAREKRTLLLRGVHKAEMHVLLAFLRTQVLTSRGLRPIVILIRIPFVH